MKKQLFIYTILLFIVPLVYLGCSKDEDPVQFSLTVTVTPINSGTVSPSSGIFDDGKEITISATPAEGYDFLKWSGNATGDSNPIQLTVSSDTKIIAEFALQDSDGDGIGDALDQCPNTPEGEAVDATGCATSELDSDGDGVTDNLDLCPETPSVTSTDDSGCPLASEYTYIPDDDFEQIIIDMGYDDVLDDYVLTNAINTITDLWLPGLPTINSGYAIKDFTGIEAFAALERLSILHANLTVETIDLSQNSNLKELLLICSFVADLDLSQTNIEMLSIRGDLFFGPCEDKISGLDLSGVTTLKTLNIYNAEFDDLNVTLNSATSVVEMNITSPQEANGPVDYLDLSANSNLTSVEITAMYTIGPSIINIKNGANQQITEMRLESSDLILDPWKPCIEADDPVYIESIITTPYTAPEYTVTTDCDN